jgi:hypothetical protein
VEGLLPENQTAILYGDGGQGKSFVALALGAAVAAGSPFLGIQTLERHVLYLDWELDQEEHTRRAYKIARGEGLQKPPGGLLYSRAEEPLHNLLSPLAAWIKEKDVGLLIIDSFGAACGGDPEQARFVIPLLASLRSLNVSILVLDHQAKMQEGQKYAGKTPFGSAYKFNLARSVIQSQKVGSRPGELSLILRPTKYNLGQLGSEIPVKLHFGDTTVRIERGDLANDPDYYEHLSSEKKIILCLEEEGSGTAKELGEKTGINQKTIINILGKLKRAGRVCESGKKLHSPVYVLSFPTSQSYIRREDGNISIVEQAQQILDAEVVS